MTKSNINALIAGIGGASLGTEILKCLRDIDRYTIFGCDISEYAYGHYETGFAKTFLISKERYIESICEICVKNKIQIIIPGGEEPLTLLSENITTFNEKGIHIAANSADVISVCHDKKKLFELLKKIEVPIPWTEAIENIGDIERHKNITYPCVIKPTVGSGGSKFVFLASNPDEANLYLKYLLTNGITALIQEYISLEDGEEFTIGVLSASDGRVIGSIAMRRLFHTKLSVLAKTKIGLISSGYSQGLIDEFPEVCAQAEKIAMALGSTGPMNIQGRVCNGALLPFEVNPRFSASTYLRALAGFNEVDIYLQAMLPGTQSMSRPQIRPGYYLRSLSETYVGMEGLKR